MEQNKFIKKKKIIAYCEACGNALYDGDTAYKLMWHIYCPPCIDSALIICRNADETAKPKAHFSEKGVTISNIPHREIYVNTNEITLKNTAKQQNSERMSHID